MNRLLSPGKKMAYRNAYFGATAGTGTVETRVIARSELAQGSMQGPLIVEEFDATCIIPWGSSAELDTHGNIVIDAGTP